MSNPQNQRPALDTHQRLALVTLRTALDALKVAELACMAADLGSVYVLDPLETAHREIASAVAALNAMDRAGELAVTSECLAAMRRWAHTPQGERAIAAECSVDYSAQCIVCGGWGTDNPDGCRCDDGPHGPGDLARSVDQRRGHA